LIIALSILALNVRGAFHSIALSDASFNLICADFKRLTADSAEAYVATPTLALLIASAVYAWTELVFKFFSYGIFYIPNCSSFVRLTAAAPSVSRIISVAMILSFIQAGKKLALPSFCAIHIFASPTLRVRVFRAGNIWLVRYLAIIFMAF
jgi:hypothetical protein